VLGGDEAMTEAGVIAASNRRVSTVTTVTTRASRWFPDVYPLPYLDITLILSGVTVAR
jgi:hypothetical protein